MASLPNRRILRRGLGIIGMSIRLQPKAFVAGLMGSWLYAGMTVAGAAVLGAVTDRVIVPSIERGSIGFGTLAGATAAIIGVAILEAVGVFARRTGAFYMVYRLQATFRKRVTEQYQRLSMAWHRNHSTGELLSRANSDVETMFWLIHPLPFACGVIFMVVITLVALALTDLFLTMLGLLMIPAIALLSNVYGKRSNDVATRAQEMRAAVSGVAHESFDGALVVKTLGLEDEETARFRAESERLRDELIHLGTLRAVFDPVMEALPNVAVLALLAVGTWRIASGDLSTGDVVQFAYLFTRLAFPLRAIGWILGDMPRAVVGWERVKRVLEAGDFMRYGGLHLEPDGSSARLGVRGASFGYEDGDVLRKLDMEVPAGKTIAVVGPTGSGKSTITNLLVRLADPSVGLIALDDQDLKELRQGVVPDNASIVFQESFLFDDTVRENIVLGEAVDDQAVEEAARLAQAHDFISALPQGYDTIVGERGTTLSGGQRQRVALARALIRRPRLLIMDDATSSVDPSVEQAILQGLRRAALPSTTIVVAYRRATIALADEVVFLRHGTIEARGPHEQLAARVPAYSRLISAYDFAIEDPPA